MLNTSEYFSFDFVGLPQSNYSFSLIHKSINVITIAINLTENTTISPN
jgi:hypothetical protein